ncbi:MAG: PQQ-binding-like beta-propeller repeat protein [Mariniblastus sp.]
MFNHFGTEGDRFESYRVYFLIPPKPMSNLTSFFYAQRASQVHIGPRYWDAIINRAGLTVEWFTHSGVGAGGKLSDWHINVNENKSTTFFTVTAGSYQEKFSQHKLDAFGNPYGIDGGAKFASLRKEIITAELANDGIKDVEVKIDRYTLPETTIYALTSNAMLKAIDGDSGEIKWSQSVGDARLPSIGVGSSNTMVAAVNGETVYAIDASNGKILWTATCRFAPSAPPTVNEDKIYVPLLNGRLETFAETVTEEAEEDIAAGKSKEADKSKGFKDESKVKKSKEAKTAIQSYAFVSKGRGTARPTITDLTVAWTTSNGDMNVAAKYGPRPGVAYQLRSDDAIVSPAVFQEKMYFVTSLDGFVYAVDHLRGTIVWQFSTGHSISQAAIPLGEYIFVINDRRQMFKFEGKTGKIAPGWEKPLENVENFVGAGKTHMYVLDRYGSLKVLSQDSGTTIASTRIEDVQSILSNLENDRLYIASSRGMIQCLREIGSPIPHFHSNEFVAVKIEPSKAKSNMNRGTSEPAAGSSDLDDPFRSNKPADNPFAKPSSDVDVDNPFKALVAPAMENPDERKSARVFELLQHEAQAFSRSTMGVGMDMPAWLAALENEVHINLVADKLLESNDEAGNTINPPTPSLASLREQLEDLPRSK